MPSDFQGLPDSVVYSLRRRLGTLGSEKDYDRLELSRGKPPCQKQRASTGKRGGDDDVPQHEAHYTDSDDVAESSDSRRSNSLEGLPPRR